MIDKGVQRHDYETGHSAAAYRRAQEALARIHSPTMLGDPSVVWARGKLRQYEACQRSDCAPQGPPGPSATTYRYETLVDAVKTRRSIRSYSNRPVPRDVINKIVEGINWSPCSCCRQPAKVFVTHDPELAKACLATCKGASGFGEFVPCFMSFCVDLRPYDLPREVFLPAVDLGLGIQNCCLIAHSLGLSLTLLSWAQHDKEEGNQLRALLGIPTCYEIMVNGALGYPDSGAPVPDRKSLASTLVLRESPTGAHQHRTKCGTTDTTQHG
ncbi:MAG: nitroreductase family protein [Armatimonadota bacterium]|nr:MAG: nitroreductase family protein [Armatimonadota bacterium]